MKCIASFFKTLSFRGLLGSGYVFVIFLAFLVNTVGPLPLAQAGPASLADRDFRLPQPGVMVHLSPPFDPPILKGIKVHSDNPFRFDFILDKGDVETPLMASLRNESTKLIKYFLASLTIPEKDLWVNLSPYEKDRIIPQSFGLTEMGRDLLAEDYMLKQITASLIYPEGEVGKRFWQRIYQEAAKRFHTTNTPVSTFNKVWILPEKAVIYENAKAQTAYVVEAKLKVMLEEDYLALSNHGVIASEAKQSFNKIASLPSAPRNDTSSLASHILREIVIPELTKEVNENKNFAQLRQVYNSLILATWYKKKIKDSILAQVYADKNKTMGLSFPEALIGSSYRTLADARNPQYIYQQYLKAFKKGVYNYIKEEIDPATQEKIAKKYFSGGVELGLDFDAAQTSMKMGRHVLQVTKVLPDFAMNVDAKREVIAVAQLDAAMATPARGSLLPEKDQVWRFDINALFENGYTHFATGDRNISFFYIKGLYQDMYPAFVIAAVDHGKVIGNIHVVIKEREHYASLSRSFKDGDFIDKGTERYNRRIAHQAGVDFYDLLKPVVEDYALGVAANYRFEEGPNKRGIRNVGRVLMSAGLEAVRRLGGKKVEVLRIESSEQSDSFYRNQFYAVTDDFSDDGRDFQLAIDMNDWRAKGLKVERDSGIFIFTDLANSENMKRGGQGGDRANSKSVGRQLLREGDQAMNGVDQAMKTPPQLIDGSRKGRAEKEDNVQQALNLRLKSNRRLNNTNAVILVTALMRDIKAVSSSSKGQMDAWLFREINKINTRYFIPQGYIVDFDEAPTKESNQFNPFLYKILRSETVKTEEQGEVDVYYVEQLVGEKGRLGVSPWSSKYVLVLEEQIRSYWQKLQKEFKGYQQVPASGELSAERVELLGQCGAFFKKMVEAYSVEEMIRRYIHNVGIHEVDHEINKRRFFSLGYDPVFHENSERLSMLAEIIQGDPNLARIDFIYNIIAGGVLGELTKRVVNAMTQALGGLSDDEYIKFLLRLSADQLQKYAFRAYDRVIEDVLTTKGHMTPSDAAMHTLSRQRKASVDRIIQEAYADMVNNRKKFFEAAKNIVDALAQVTKPQRVTNIKTAIGILESTSTQITYLRLLKEYDTMKDKKDPDWWQRFKQAYKNRKQREELITGLITQALEALKGATSQDHLVKILANLTEALQSKKFIHDGEMTGWVLKELVAINIKVLMNKGYIVRFSYESDQLEFSLFKIEKKDVIKNADQEDITVYYADQISGAKVRNPGYSILGYDYIVVIPRLIHSNLVDIQALFERPGYELEQSFLSRLMSQYAFNRLSGLHQKNIVVHEVARIRNLRRFSYERYNWRLHERLSILTQILEASPELTQLDLMANLILGGENAVIAQDVVHSLRKAYGSIIPEDQYRSWVLNLSLEDLKFRARIAYRETEREIHRDAIYLPNRTTATVLPKTGLTRPEAGGVNRAMVNEVKILSRNTGGIDLTPANMNLQTNGDNNGIKFHLDPSQLAQLRSAPGFVPIITNIQPMTDLKKFLDLVETPS